MIVYLSTDATRGVIEDYLDSWAGDLKRTVQHVAYEALTPSMKVPVATYLFTDFERLTTAQMSIAEQFHRQLVDQGMRTINDPQKFVPRFPFLRSLCEDALNDFNVYRPHEIGKVRYPAFVRVENDHDGPRSALLHSQPEVEDMLLRGLAFGIRPEDLMIVEFCDCCPPDGFFRKYAYWNFGGHVIPNHALIDRNWITKGPVKASGDRWNTSQLAEEQAFMSDRPYREEAKAAFERVGLDYGRIDFGVRNGRVQVWEVNSHPVPNHAPAKCLEERLPTHRQFCKLWVDGMRSIDTPEQPGRAIPVRLDPLEAMKAR